MKNVRIPMFVKFLLGCLTLAALLIGGGTFVFRKETQRPSQGNFLAKHLRRYQGYEDRSGRGMTGALEIMAEDARVRAVLGGQNPSGDDKSAGPPSAASVGESLYSRLTTKNNVQPDFFVIFTAKTKAIWSSPNSPIKGDDLTDMAAVDRVRAGNVFAHRLVLIENTPYQVSAVPVRAGSEGEVVGGLLAGVRVQRYYLEYAEQSDDVAERRIRPSFLRGQDVTASAYPEDQFSTLGKAMQPDKFAKIKVGEEDRIVLKFGGADVDFYSEDAEGYKGLEKTTVGKVFLTRTRTATDDGSKVPWVEILIGVVLSVGIALFMAFWITRPIKRFVVQSKRLLEGDTDLTQRLVVESRDETADLAENINQVFARLQGLASGVQTAAFQVGASSAEISAASKQMLSGIKDQALKIESSTAAVTELSASIQQVAENAAQASSDVEKSNVAVSSAVERMDQIRGAVEDAASKMHELDESSKRVGNIVEVIRQISEQTSLLALNAAIQAAQAGEHGRGFAVVADEVSSLARRAGQSAKDIEGLIQTIKEQTAAAVVSMEKGTTEVDSGTQLVSTTLADLTHLMSVVRDTAQAVQEQAVVSDEIARNMDAVRRIASEVLTGAEESVLQGERLHELAFELEQSIGGFHLEGSLTPLPSAPAALPPAEPQAPASLPQKPTLKSLPPKTAARPAFTKPSRPASKPH
ncbi:MAG: HAMP domain-containing protein [Polyangiaceae bacterium]|nr:HAMP domain-containing protein [Polyangiaceae bacterium]